ncbi:ABC transporter substrate-binding protein [Canibacter zhoujuaniae]|uniref:ABC transporter substrate-binding protein n=1 Tax=Canibacter zhoujuaniae TaxID=2708343 RepID=UPI0014245C67|nr:ABC transporter substrate-binding protein [Canibacter zhoujuaniae]
MSFTRTRKALVTVASVALAASLVACASKGGSSSEDAAAKPETNTIGAPLTAGVAYDTTNFHPSNTTSALAMGTNLHVVEGFWELDYTNNASAVPALAAGDPVEVGENTYEITLRDGAKFSDGTPVTAADVESSYKRIVDPEAGSLYAGFLTFIKSIEAKDDMTVTVTLSSPFGQLKERLALIKIVPSAATDEELTAKPIGSGPYKYESVDGAAEVTAVPNEHYNGPRPATSEKLTWLVQKDDTARTTAASDGTIDVIENVPAGNREVLEAAGLKVDSTPGFGVAFMMFNTAKAPFDNAKVRQAFHYAIDTQKLIDNNLGGEATEASSFLNEGHPNYKRASHVYTHDTAKAKELLASAGVSGLTVNILTTDHPWVAELAPQIKNDLAAAGIEATIESMATADLYPNRAAGNAAEGNVPNFDVIVAPGDPSVFGTDPALLFGWWLGDNAWTQERSNWKNSDPEKFAEFQELLNAGASATDAADAQKKWEAVQDFASEEVAIYPLFHRSILTGYSADVSGFKAIGTTGLTLLGAHKAE